ncbi:MAG: hypothetical protein JRJ04_07845 [Deltaproteobacteria bacterium]|nr:hypothetical protein [Deltaproteobacteria bacterium]
MTFYETVIDWLLNISTDSGMIINYPFQVSGPEAWAWEPLNYDEDWDYIASWVDTSATASVPDATGEGCTSDTEIGESVRVDVTGYKQAESYVWAARGADFEVLNGNGYIYISLDYYLYQDMRTEFLVDWAEGWAWAGLWLHNDDAGTDDYDEDELDNAVYDGASFIDGKDNTLFVFLFFPRVIGVGLVF